MKDLYEKVAAHYNVNVLELVQKLAKNELFIQKYYVDVGHFDKDGNPNF